MINNITIIGNLTKDPEFYEGKETDIVTLSVAVNRNKEETDFFTVKAFGDVANLCQEYLAKGKKVAVNGHMQSRKYEDKHGENRVVWEVIARNIEFLTPPEEKEKSSKKSTSKRK